MARFLRETKTLFQHVPRTGGTWIENAIAAMGLNHDRCLDWGPLRLPRKHLFKSHYVYLPDEVLNVVAFVRHPLAYYESVWKYLKNVERRPELIRRFYTRWDWHPKRTAALHYQPHFDDWVFLMLKKDPLWYTRIVEGYVGPAGAEYCNYVGRTENLIVDFRTIMSHLGHADRLDRIRDLCKKKVNGVDLPTKWNNDLREEVLKTESQVIERFYANDTYDVRVPAWVDTSMARTRRRPRKSQAG